MIQLFKIRSILRVKGNSNAAGYASLFCILPMQLLAQLLYTRQYAFLRRYPIQKHHKLITAKTSADVMFSQGAL